MTDETIKSTVRKLLNLASDDAATDGEIENALTFAKKMMDKHHLSEEDLVEEPEDQYSKIDSAGKKRKPVSVGKKFYTWENWLSIFVTNFVGGVGVYREDGIAVARDHRTMFIPDKNGEPYYGRRYQFYGIAEDVDLATEIFHELRMIILAMSKMKFGTSFKGDGAAYAQGFVQGLFTKLKNQEKEEQKRIRAEGNSTALVLVERRQDLVRHKEKTARSWLSKELGVSLRTGGSSGGTRTGSHEAYSEGREDGQRTDVNTARRKRIKSS